MLKYEQSELRRINKARQEGLSLRVERSSKISCTDTTLGIGIKTQHALHRRLVLWILKFALEIVVLYLWNIRIVDSLQNKTRDKMRVLHVHHNSWTLWTVFMCFMSGVHSQERQ